MAIDPEIIKQVKNGELCALAHHRLTDGDLPPLVELLKKDRTILRLDLSYGDLGDDAAKAIAEALKTNQTLMYLSLSGNRIANEGAAAFAEALKINKTLIELDLSTNRITDKAAVIIAEALKINQTLVELNLYGNRTLVKEGIIALAEALKNNKTLSVIKLPWVVHGDAIKVFVESVKDNPNIIYSRSHDALKEISDSNEVIIVNLVKKARDEPDHLTLEDIEKIKRIKSAFVLVAEVETYSDSENNMFDILSAVRKKADSFGVQFDFHPFVEEQISLRINFLPETFQPEKWVGRINEMEKEWQETPDYLKKTFDFSSAITEVRQKMLKTHPVKRLPPKSSNP